MLEVKVSEDVLLNEVFIEESLLVATLWNEPSLFSSYREDKLNKKHIGNSIWKFYFELGRELFNRGIQVFDDISVANILKDKNWEKFYKKYGEYETIEEIMLATKGTEDNFEAHFEMVKKYSLLRGLRELLGDKVITKTKKYDYHKLTRQELENYWQEKHIQINMENSDTKVKEYNLFDNLEELVDKLDDDNNVGMPFYEMENFSGIMNGMVKGVVYLLSAFSGLGKSSFIVYGLVMACIRHKQKLLIIANEMDIEAYQKLLLVSVMGSPLNEKLYAKYNSQFNRGALDKGKFSVRDRERVEEAIKWIRENVEQNDLVKFIPIEHYTMDNVEQILRYYKRKGYDFAVIDTCKPSENRGNNDRWVQFVEDFETIYKLAKKDSLDMGIFCTVQNADSYINTKFLDYSCIGDGKKIKNTVDFCCHIRIMHDSEKIGEKALEVRNDDGKLVKLKPMATYYLIFVSKNRRGLTNSGSNLPILVVQVDLNTNVWKEIGWTKVVNDNQ